MLVKLLRNHGFGFSGQIVKVDQRIADHFIEKGIAEAYGVKPKIAKKKKRRRKKKAESPQ
tara:strand:+ start:291 stop:470 length:180 start_codon:yes stop_codon:yes gene_type:complete